MLFILKPNTMFYVCYIRKYDFEAVSETSKTFSSYLQYLLKGIAHDVVESVISDCVPSGTLLINVRKIENKCIHMVNLDGISRCKILLLVLIYTILLYFVAFYIIM